LIFDCEMKLNHPVAARAALALAIRFDPGKPELAQAMDAVFGAKNPNLPASAKQELKFQSLSSNAPPEQRAAWESALAGASAGELSEAADAFEQLTEKYPDEKAAWYNLAICLAWLGKNPESLEALDRYVALEADETRAAAAWAFGEVLRCGQGMIDQADY